LPSLDFVFDAGLKKIEEQVKEIEALDLKMAVLIGFLGALVVGLLAVLFALDSTKITQLLSTTSKIGLAIGVLFITATLYHAFQGFRLRNYYGGVKFKDLVGCANQDIQATKEKFLPTLIRTIEVNELPIAKKQSHANRAIWFVFFAFLAFLVTLAEVGIRNL